MLLQVLLGKVLQISLGEWKLGSDVDLGLLAVDLDLGSEVASLAVNLDAVVEVLLESSSIEDLVLNRFTAVNGELGNSLLGGLLGSFLRLQRKEKGKFIFNSE